MLTKLNFTNNNPAAIQKKIDDAPECFALFPNMEHPNFKDLAGFDENTLLLFANQIEDGIFETSSFSFDYCIEDYTEWNPIDSIFFKDSAPFDQSNDDWDRALCNFGVADNLDQIKNYFKNVIGNPDVNFVIAFTRIKKESQPKEGGWRWCKWGDYIGDKTPQCEYLADESEIEEVLVFHGYFLQNKNPNYNLPDYDNCPKNGIYA